MNAVIRLLARLLVVKIVLDRLRSDRKSGHDRLRATAPPRPQPRRAPQPQPTEATTEATIPVQTGGGPGADSPLELDAPDWKQTIKRTLKEIKADRVTLIAAGMAYYFFLAIFPAVIAAIGIMDLAGISTTALVEWIRTTLPGGAGQVLIDAVQGRDPSHSASLIAALTGIALALWSASSGFVALQAGLNVAYDVPDDRKFIGKRAVALGLIVATALLGGVPSPFFSFGERTIYTVIGWILTIVAVMVLFAIYYTLGPKRDTPRWVWVSPGGIVGAIIWIVASISFGVYVTQFSSYGKTYGSLAGVIVLILWLYLTSISILVGGELNAELERQNAINLGRATEPRSR
jgi:membrane protein